MSRKILFFFPFKIIFASKFFIIYRLNVDESVDKLQIISVKKSARRVLETLDCICSRKKRKEKNFYRLAYQCLEANHEEGERKIVFESHWHRAGDFHPSFHRTKLMRTRYWIRLLIWNVLLIHIASFSLVRHFTQIFFSAAADGESIKKLSCFCPLGVNETEIQDICGQCSWKLIQLICFRLFKQLA